MRGVGRVTVLNTCEEAAIQEAVRECDALLVRTTARVTRALLQRASRLRVIGRGGSGLDNIDIIAARERGIAVVYTPEAATDAVADLTVGLMVALVRRIKGCDTAVREGRFAQERARHEARDLQELTLGIVGLGRIGRAVARRCRQGFGMGVVYNDIVDPGPLDFDATPLQKAQLYGSADVISLHLPLTDETRKLIDEKALRRFRSGSFLINTARGAVVDGEAVARALRSGALAGAAFDVLDPEPPPPDHPLLTAPNTLFTPHVGARTRGGLARMDAVVEDVIRVLEGSPAHYPAWR